MNPRATLRYTVTAAALGSVLGVLPGCGRDLDNLYGGAGPPPFPEVGAYLQQPECKACIEQASGAEGCATQWDKCMADEECVRLYECSILCTDLGCHRRCNNPDDIDEYAQGFVTGITFGAYGRLENCLSTRCVDDCAIGQDFRCTGRWEYPKDIEQGSEVEVSVGVTEWGSGATPEVEASFCIDGDVSCTMPVSTVTTIDGVAKAKVKANTPDGFRGFIRFQPTEPPAAALLDQLIATYTWASWPMDGYGAHVAFVMRRGVSAAYWESVDQEYDPERSSISVVTFDCHGWMAPGLRVDTDADCSPLERCDNYYSGTLLTKDLRETQGLTVGAPSANVTPAAGLAVDLRVVHVATERPVSHFAGVPQPNSNYIVFLAPLTTSQLKTLEDTPVTGEQ